MKKISFVFVFSLALAVFHSTLNASEFRGFSQILTAANVPDGAKVLRQQEMKPVSRKLTEKAVKKVVSAWNANNLNSILGKDYYDKLRLNDAMNGSVPRDAQLSLLAIQNSQTLQQHVMDTPKGSVLVSTVSVTAKTQVTFNDANGYQRREGTNQYVFEIRQSLKN